MLRLLVVILVIGVISQTTSYRLNLNNITNSFEIDAQLSENVTVNVLRNQFTILSQLGNGTTSHVYLVQKLGGSDDGKFYALKAIDLLPKSKPNPANVFYKQFNVEREVSEAARELPFAIGLHYAWRVGKWLFMVLDLLTAGDVLIRYETNQVNETTTKYVLAEVISIVEKLHKAGILHQDAVLQNFLINDDGHLVLTDFGASRLYSDDRSSHWDWKCIYFSCVDLFPKESRNENQNNLLNKLKNMTDAQLPQLKNQPYFVGIDWEEVAEGMSSPPFNPDEIQINLENPSNIAALLETAIDDEHEPIRAEHFPNFSYVAPEYQN